MGRKFENWNRKGNQIPSDLSSLEQVIVENRNFSAVDKLQYGDHGLQDAYEKILEAIKQNKKIALYADYDVDGTMSCVSWIWFLKSIGFQNFIHYIPDRFTEGYGVNFKAVKKLVEEDKAQVIITMDTGITANEEAEWCISQGVDFICTDHHKIQEDKMPDCIILNPKMHPDEIYQELCGCGITFVLLRKLGQVLQVPSSVWIDILALTGIATICDVVPLNGVNHKLAKQGVDALSKSQRPVLKKLLSAASIMEKAEESDVGFRLGPRINAVGRLEHANKVVEAFVNEDPGELIKFMGICNEKRKLIQAKIVDEARELAPLFSDDPILFMGGDWHPGVVGIAASKISEENWKPTWMFEKMNGICKGSARSIAGFDVTEAMLEAKHLFTKFGGHKAAGGFSFAEENEDAIRKILVTYANSMKVKQPEIWRSTLQFDCDLPLELAQLDLIEKLEGMRPFGHGFEEPKFRIKACVQGVQFYNDKETGLPKHTAITVSGAYGVSQKIMFFNEVHAHLETGKDNEFIVTVSKNIWKGKTSLSMMGLDLN